MGLNIRHTPVACLFMTATAAPTEFIGAWLSVCGILLISWATLEGGSYGCDSHGPRKAHSDCGNTRPRGTRVTCCTCPARSGTVGHVSSGRSDAAAVRFAFCAMFCVRGILGRYTCINCVIRCFNERSGFICLCCSPSLFMCMNYYLDE